MIVKTSNYIQTVNTERGSAALCSVLGLLAFTALAWFCVARHVPVMEQRLRADVLNAIGPEQAGRITVEMNGYTANISGAVLNSLVRNDIIAAAASTPGIRSVNSDLQIIASPVTTRVDNDNDNDNDNADADGAEVNIVQPATPAPQQPTEAETVAQPLAAPNTETSAVTSAVTSADTNTDTSPGPADNTNADTNTRAIADASQNTDLQNAPSSIRPNQVAGETPEVPVTTVSQATTNVTTDIDETPAASAGDEAELNIAIANRTVTLSGRVQDQRELRPIVETVMTTFDLNYVSNNTAATASIAPMVWMDELLISIADLTDVSNPTIDIFNQQMIVSGRVDTEEDRQRIVESLQEKLTDLTLVSRLQVGESGEAARVEPPQAADTAPLATPSTGTDAQLAVKPADIAEPTETATPSESAELNEPADPLDPTAVTGSSTTEADGARRQAEIEEEFRIAAREREDAERTKAGAEAGANAAADTAAESQGDSTTRTAEASSSSTDSGAATGTNPNAESADVSVQGTVVELNEIDPVTEASQTLSAAFASLPDTRILFTSGSDLFTRDSVERLDAIVELLSEYPIVPVAIKGYTDSQGDEAANLVLSQLRANAVRDYLVSKGISVFRLSSFGYGESLPIATNDTPDGRAANRRIEFSF